MSMSTLGAQLAALNSASQGGGSAAGAATGSALPTSRRLDDAVGRGLYHNAQVGYSVVDTNKFHIVKASILFPDARQASNVPLTTLKENCVSALDELAMLDPIFGEYTNKLCQKSSFERGLRTKAENQQVDATIQELLHRLAVRMMAGSAADSSPKGAVVDVVHCGLTVMEFLMRQYDVHLRPKLVSTVLLMWLPHHEHAYFLRWLQLVDLANLPTYSWLRPYALPNAKVGRDVITKAASKNVALCRDLLSLTTKAASLPQADATLSFTAAVWVEAMTLQQRSTGSVDERTCQALLPVIRRACLAASKNPLFANWGYIMASTLVETSCLADEPRKGLITSILQGLSHGHHSSKVGKTKAAESTGEDDDHHEMELDESKASVDDGTIQNAMIVVVSFLQQQPPSSIDAMNDDQDASFAKVTAQLTVGSDKPVKYGYPNASCIDDKAIWQCLMDMDHFVVRLSQLFVEEGFLDFVHWIASLWVVGWNRLEILHKKKSDKSKHKKQQLAIEDFLRALLQDVNLTRALWSKPEWIESLVCFVLTNTSIPDPKQTDKSINTTFLDEILDILRRKNITSYDRGVAMGLLKYKRHDRTLLASYLGLTKKSNDEVSATLIENESEAEMGIRLPPRVALEHADVEIRLEAIERVLAQEENADSMDVEGGETVVEALMRRVVADDDIHVATLASAKLSQLLDKKIKSKTTEGQYWNGTTFARDAQRALCKWTEKSQVEHKARMLLLSHVLHLNGLAANARQRSAEGNDLLVELVEAIGAFLVHGETTIVAEASKAILLALTGKKARKPSDKEARAAIMSHDSTLLQQLARETEPNSNPSQHTFRRRFVPSILKGLSETLSSRSNKDETDERSSIALHYCLWAMRSFPKSLSKDDQALLLDVLKRTTKKEVSSDLPQLLSNIALISQVDDHLYESVGAPYLMEACMAIRDKENRNVPGISVVCEMALRLSDSPNQIERLLLVVQNCISVDSKNCHLALIPLLTLLSHSEASVRKRVIDSLGLLEKEAKRVGKLNVVEDLLKSISASEATAAMGSPKLLATCLRTATIEAKNSTKFQTLLLELILYWILGHATDGTSSLPNSTSDGFISFETLEGGHYASLKVLEAMQEAGEGAFPLLSQWRIVGKRVLDFVRGSDLSDDLTASSANLLDRVTLMLKGRKSLPEAEGSDVSNVIITSGPAARGGRKRSYSFGKGEVSSFLIPYPKEMSSALVAALSSPKTNKAIRRVRNAICEHILESEAWSSSVYKSLSSSDRQRLISALLRTMTHDLAGNAEEAFFFLPIMCSDLTKLLEEQLDGDESLAFIAYLADFASANAKRLSKDEGLVDLLVLILDKLMLLSLKVHEDAEGLEFVRSALLGALIELLEAMSEATTRTLSINKKKKFTDWVGMLVGLVAPAADSAYRPVESTRSKRAALSVLKYFCALYPMAITHKLTTAVVSMVSVVSSEKEAAIVADCLASIVPVYLKHAPEAKLTPSNLIDAFVSATTSGIESASRVILFQGFVDAICKKGESVADSLGAFIASILAADVSFADQPGRTFNSSLFMAQLATQIEPNTAIQSLLVLVSYARDLVLLLGGSKVEDSTEVPLKHLLLVAHSGPVHDPSPDYEVETPPGVQRKLCTALVVAICEMLTTNVFARFLRHCSTENSAAIVQLWQDLLLIQSVFESELGVPDGEARTFWSTVSESANEALEFIQQHLPSHIFLAFATSLVKDSDSDDLRARALQLVADRSLQLDCTDPESALFLEMLPYLTSLADEADTSSQVMMHQTAFIAIEHIVRTLCFSAGGIGIKYLDKVSKTLEISGQTIEKCCRDLDSAKLETISFNTASAQLFCTASLCAATTLRACGVRALPCLPKLLRPSLELLGRVNKVLCASNIESSFGVQARALQLSVLRMVGAMVDTIPQFLSPYIEAFFEQSSLPSPALHRSSNEQEESIKVATERLCTNIATKLPARHLLMPLAVSLSRADSPRCVKSLVDVMTKSINSAKATELSGMSNTILNVATFVFDYAEKILQEQNELLEAGIALFMAAVLKLSEIQLRKVYTKLHLWRGEFNKNIPSMGAFRRLCFWFLSAKLGSTLKSIFLPFFASVFSDAVEELETSVAFLKKKNELKTAGGTKKQRIDMDASEYDETSLRSLQGVLKCLEMSLRADAHEGGSWIRDGETQRFDSLLEPLGKLLQCNVVYSGNRLLSFKELVQGNKDDSGCVTECLVALALAAGDENKWKPLNHAVLQACSHETRTEVRKAGVTCLLSLIKSIGEEYMVLIPECLPVLSELLEESDEDIVGMAQECIAISEDLLGESLEDNLR